MLSNIKFGRVNGTGADINVELGWIPSKVEVINLTNANKLEHYTGMADGSAIKQLANAGAAVDPIITVAAPAGVTRRGGAPGATYQGFTIGTDANVNIAGTNNLLWVAYRDGPGSGA